LAHRRRTYRSRTRPEGLVEFRMRIGETNLQILAGRDLSGPARSLARDARAELHRYRKLDPRFFETLGPHDVPLDAPPLVREMARAGKLAGVGPMAAVAGAIAERVGRGLMAESSEVIVENGGDLFISITRPRRVAVFAGDSPLSMKLALEIAPGQTPLGVATSSATVGPSVNFGKADAAVVLAPDAALADAAATALGNRVRSGGDLEPALAWALGIEGVRGALVVLGGQFAARGEVRLAEPARD
jgi:ApbE superfamily uncharacterized protein (UPF0280 family)